MTGVLAGKTVVAVSANYHHSGALTSDGKVYAWGYNGTGQLGDGTALNRLNPEAVNMTGVLLGKTVSAFSMGPFHTLALTTEGKIYS